MTDTIQLSREQLKSILAEILQNQGPRSRTEIFAREIDYKTNAAMDANDISFDASNLTLAIKAAEGNVLPLLVASTLPMLLKNQNTHKYIIPRSDEILKESSKQIERSIFKQSLNDVLLSAKNDPEGLPRWFFSVCVADTLFKPKENQDKFWLSKAAELLCGILSMAQHIPLDNNIDEETINLLHAIPIDNLSPWEKHGQKNSWTARSEKNKRKHLFHND
jgi:hypothetical protein